MEQRKSRSNRQAILGLIHLARFVIYAGFVLAMWIEFITWRPVLPLPGGPVVAQFRPTIPTLAITGAAIVRGILSWKIWSFKRRTVEIAAALDLGEFMLVVSMTNSMLSHIIYFNLVSSALMLGSLAVLSICSLFVSILVEKDD